MNATITRCLSLVLSTLFFLNQCVLSSLAESNFWSERQAETQEKLAPIQLAALPNALNQPATLQNVLNNLPSFDSGIAAASKWNTPKISATSAIPEDLRKLVESVPATYGSVQNVHDSGRPDLQPVVLLQDVHLNNEAQLNIAAILQSLIDQRQVGLVGVEGAFGEFDFSQFRSFPNKESSKEIVDDALNKNLLAAPSYVGITSLLSPPAFLGVDDRTHYDANIESLYRARNTKPLVKRELHEISVMLEKAKRQLFSKNLLEFDRVRRSYYSGELSFGAYVEKLSAFDAEHDVIIDQFLEAYNTEQHLDFKKVEQERRVVIEKLAAVLNNEQMSNLMAASVSYRMGRLGFGGYMKFFRELCIESKIPLSRTPHFDEYVQYVLLSDGLQSDRLFDAVDNLANNVVAQLAVSSDEKNVSALSGQIFLIEKLIEFSLTPNEWETYKKNQQTLEAVSASVSKLVGSPAKTIRTSLDSFEAFYQEADARSRKMVENLLAHKSENARILVLGGFHSPQVAQILRKEKVSYVTVSPRLSRVDDSGSSYLSIFEKDKLPLDRMFAGEKLFVYPEHLAVGTKSAATHLMNLLLGASLLVLPGNSPDGAKEQTVRHGKYAYHMNYKPTEHANNNFHLGPVTVMRELAWRHVPDQVVESVEHNIGGLMLWLKAGVMKIFPRLRSQAYNHWVAPILENGLVLMLGAVFAGIPTYLLTGDFLFSAQSANVLAWLLFGAGHLLDERMVDKAHRSWINFQLASIVSAFSVFSFLPIPVVPFLLIVTLGATLIHMALNRLAPLFVDADKKQTEDDRLKDLFDELTWFELMALPGFNRAALERAVSPLRDPGNQIVRSLLKIDRNVLLVSIRRDPIGFCYLVENISMSKPFLKHLENVQDRASSLMYGIYNRALVDYLDVNLIHDQLALMVSHWSRFLNPRMILLMIRIKWRKLKQRIRLKMVKETDSVSTMFDQIRSVAALQDQFVAFFSPNKIAETQTEQGSERKQISDVAKPSQPSYILFNPQNIAKIEWTGVPENQILDVMKDNQRKIGKLLEEEHFRNFLVQLKRDFPKAFGDLISIFEKDPLWVLENRYSAIDYSTVSEKLSLIARLAPTQVARVPWRSHLSFLVSLKSDELESTLSRCQKLIGDDFLLELPSDLLSWISGISEEQVEKARLRLQSIGVKFNQANEEKMNWLLNRTESEIEKLKALLDQIDSKFKNDLFSLVVHFSQPDSLQSLLSLDVKFLSRWFINNRDDFMSLTGVTQTLASRYGDHFSAFVIDIVRKRDIAAVQSLDQIKNLPIKPYVRLLEAFISGPATYSKKLSIIIQLSDWAALSGLAKEDLRTRIENELEDAFRTLTGGALVGQIEKSIDGAKKEILEGILGISIPTTVVANKGLMKKIQTLVSLRARLSSLDLNKEDKENLVVLLDQTLKLIVTSNGQADVVRNFILELTQNKTEIRRFMKAGYKKDLWESGVEVRGYATSSMSEEAKHEQRVRHTHQIVEIAKAMGLASEEDLSTVVLESSAQAEEFVNNNILARREQALAHITEDKFDQYENNLLDILREFQRLELIQQSKALEEEVTITIRKDFMAEGTAGLGVPGCFNPLTGVHAEMPLMHGFEGNAFFAIATNSQGEQLANVVLVLTAQGVYVYGDYNKTALNLDPLWAEAWKKLSMLVPAVFLDKSSAGTKSAASLGQSKRFRAKRRATLWKDPYLDHGRPDEDGVVSFDILGAVRITRKSIEKAGGFAHSADLEVAWNKKRIQDQERATRVIGEQMARFQRVIDNLQADSQTRKFKFLIGMAKSSGMALDDIAVADVREWIQDRGVSATDELIDLVFQKFAQEQADRVAASIIDPLVRWIKEFRWAYPLYWILTVLVASVWETQVFHHQGFMAVTTWISSWDINSPMTMGLTVMLVAATFSFAHTIVEWVVRANAGGWKVIRMSLKTDLRDGGVRFFVSLFFSVPFLVSTLFPSIQISSDDAAAITTLIHSLYNAAVLSGRLPRWMAVASIVPGSPSLSSDQLRTRIESLEKQIELIEKNGLPRTVYISDQHGDPQYLREVLRLVNSGQVTEVVFHGDLFDRGQENRECFELIKQLQEKLKDQFVFILGNHDVWLIQIMLLIDFDTYQNWVRHGGLPVLKEFGVVSSDTSSSQALDYEVFSDLLANSYLRQAAWWFLKNGRMSFRDSIGILHVHAGVRLNSDRLPTFDGKTGPSVASALDSFQEEWAQFQSSIGASLSEKNHKKLSQMLMRGRDLFWAREWIRGLYRPLKNGQFRLELKFMKTALHSLAASGVMYGHEHMPYLLNVVDRIFCIDADGWKHPVNRARTKMGFIQSTPEFMQWVGFRSQRTSVVSKNTILLQRLSDLFALKRSLGQNVVELKKKIERVKRKVASERRMSAQKPVTRSLNINELTGQLISVLEQDPSSRQDAVLKFLESISVEKIFDPSRPSVSVPRWAKVRKELIDELHQNFLQTNTDSSARERLADLAFLVHSILPVSEYQEFVSELEAIYQEARITDVTGTAAWVNTAEQAIKIINSRPDRDMLFLGVDAKNHAIILKALSKKGLSNKNLKKRNIVIVPHEPTINALTFIQSIKKRPEFSPYRQNRIRLLIHQGVALPADFLNIGAGSASKQMEQEALIYFVTETLQAIPVGGSLLPNWNLVRQRLAQA